MILVDTSIWIDHFRRANSELAEVLSAGEVVSHQLVIQEIALGSIKHRDLVIESLSRMSQISSLSHQEILDFVELRNLWGRGLSAIDAHLLGALLIARDVMLWTRDKQLMAAASSIGVSVFR